MSHFIFKAKKPTGETYSSSKDVADRYELYRLIRESGDEIIEVEEKKIGHGLHISLSFNSIFKRVKVMDKINFARNLGSMLDAGLPLSRAMSVLERQTHRKAFRAVITDLISEISRGVTFAEALEKHSEVFPPIFISMVRAGEQSGTLAESLKVVGLQMEKIHTLERRIKGAMIYPIIILFVMVIIGILMFIFVVPTLLATFTELKVDLPLPTRIVLYVSNLIQSHGVLLLLAVLVVAIGIYTWARRPSGKSVLHSAVLQIPIIGPLVQEVNTARAARTLSSLLNAGVNVLESVNITASVVQNVHFRAVLNSAGESIRKGELMSKVFADSGKLFPVFFAEMMSVGEETGKTTEMLGGVAKYYEEDVEQKTKDMSTIIEPFLMIIIAVAVGFFAVAMISPMYSLVNAI
jgi:type IV pilus assembly protein PilC